MQQSPAPTGSDEEAAEIQQDLFTDTGYLKEGALYSSRPYGRVWLRAMYQLGLHPGPRDWQLVDQDAPNWRLQWKPWGITLPLLVGGLVILIAQAYSVQIFIALGLPHGENIGYLKLAAVMVGALMLGLAGPAYIPRNFSQEESDVIALDHEEFQRRIRSRR